MIARRLREEFANEKPRRRSKRRTRVRIVSTTAVTLASSSSLAAWKSGRTNGLSAVYTPSNTSGIDRSQFDQDMPPWIFAWHGRDGVVFMCVPIPTSDVCSLPRVPVGTGRLVRPTIETLLEPNKWEKLLEVEVARGEMARVEAPSR